MRTRGFEEVLPDYRKTPHVDITLPVRADPRSAGYDFYLPHDVIFEPYQSVLVWTDVKAYMLEDEVLKLYIRSSLGVQDFRITNQTGIIDSSYYSNVKNDGNIGICIQNHMDIGRTLFAGERVAQGVFTKYLVADNDQYLKEEREGGYGSTT